VSSSDFVILSIENTAPCWFSVHNAANHRRQKAERRSSGAFCRPSEFALLGRTSFGLKLFIFIEHCFCRFENMPSDILHVFVGHFHYWISVNKPVFLCNNTMLPTLERYPWYSSSVLATLHIHRHIQRDVVRFLHFFSLWCIASRQLAYCFT